MKTMLQPTMKHPDLGCLTCGTSTAAGWPAPKARRTTSWARLAAAAFTLLAGFVLAAPSQAATCTISPQNPSVNTGGSVNWSATYTGFSGTPNYSWTFQGGNPSSSTSSTRTVSYANAGNFTTSLHLTRFSTTADCSTSVTVSTPDTQNPSTPQNLTATAVSSSQINLTWSASTDNVGVTNYRVYRCTGSSCTPTSQIATPTTNSYNDTGRSSNTTYRYRVRPKTRPIT